MAKHKYEKKTIVDAVGILDRDENGTIIFCVGDVEFNFEDMVEKAIGTELHFKSEIPEE